MSDGKLKILAIDDDAECLALLRAQAEKSLPDIKFLQANSGAEGLKLARAENPDVVLLDIAMPTMDGFEVCRQFKSDALLEDIPIVFLTALTLKKDILLKALDAGVDDFLCKPVEGAELIAQARVMARLKGVNAVRREANERVAARMDTGRLELEREVLKLKETEKTLRASEERYRLLVEGTNDVVYSASPEGILTYVSPQISRYGWSPEELTGASFMPLIVEEDRERIGAEFAATMATGKEMGSEFRVLSKSGETVWFSDRGKAQRDSQGNIVGANGVLLDITARKREEGALKKEQALTKAIIDSIPGTFYMLDENGCYVRWNSYQRDEIVGKPEEQMAGSPAIETKHPDDRDLIRSKIANVLINGVDEAVEGRVLMRGGPAYKWFLMTGRRLVVDGHPFLVGIGIDITDRKRKDLELAESKALVDSVVENVPLMVFLKEAKDLRFLMFNRAGEELLGYDRKNLMGKNNLDLFSPEQAAHFMAKDREVLDGKAGILDIPEEFIDTAKKGRRILHTRKVCIRGGDGKTKYLLGISEDITEHKQMQERLAHSQKIEAVGRLSGGIAHDFNNILGVIRGCAEFLQINIPSLDPKQEDVEEILNSADRAGALTRQLSAFGRRQVLAPRIADLNVILADTGKMLKRLIGEDVRLIIKPSPVPCRVKVDPGQIEQVLMNLAVNARDAMLAGGTLSMETALITPGKEFADSHPGLPPGQLVCLTVSDTGHGMTEEIKGHIFEPFFTTKETGKGLGLGLSMVYGIINQSGGEIEVESVPDAGAVFSIYLPYVEEEIKGQDKHKNKNKSRDTIHARLETVLVVDDNESFLRLTARILRADGYTVLAAAGGAEALKLLEKHGKPVDLLLTDVVMAEMNGCQLAAEVARRNLAVKTLFMSGYTDEILTRHGMSESDVLLLNKPFSQDELINKLREVLDAPAGQTKA